MQVGLYIVRRRNEDLVLSRDRISYSEDNLQGSGQDSPVKTGVLNQVEQAVLQQVSQRQDCNGVAGVIGVCSS